ncbi:DUF2219 family protein [Pedobacter sp. HMF7647]|uniref:DUF2219 family protein n=1 Tax=Hufsiella arboris TaxID=2695275 RepID=A0A7K1Y9T3_9SPHI|nr:lipid A deacylase LpxR family protein [Hufsiella arboris]MXV51356.1 DUF2219 family protein [Hufsiella arboris]
MVTFFSLTCFSQDRTFKNEIGFKSDNDSYLAQGSDRYYTNGLFFYFRHAADSSAYSGNNVKKIWEIEVGQKMFNAQSGYIPDPVYVDRSITAYLYAGFGFTWFLQNDHVLKASLQTGVIGPSALGEQAQKLIHSIAGFYEPNSWQYQLNNEFEVNSSVTYTGLIARSNGGSTDISFNGRANLGTTFTGAGISLLMRAGAINSLSQSASMHARITRKSENVKREFFFYLKPALNLVVYDGTVSGGLYVKDKGPITFDSKPFVFSTELGGVYAKNHWVVGLSAIFHTKEIESSARAHQWGSASVSYLFN